MSSDPQGTLDPAHEPSFLRPKLIKTLGYSFPTISETIFEGGMTSSKFKILNR